MFYDLHIHSCLSPCAEDEMTPSNICNMALIKGLDLIAVADHNSTRQQPAMDEVSRRIGIRILYGAELQSIEEVHILSIFRRLEDNQSFQKWIDEKMPDIPNDPNYFGKEEIKDGQDQTVATESRLLLVSLNASLEECIDAIHQYHGRAILAHVLDRQNSITNQLGFIPEGLPFDGLEIKSEEQKQRVLKMHSWLREDGTVWFIDSDAHHLVDISEAEHALSAETYQRLWGDGQ
jgi:hypothetical protein